MNKAKISFSLNQISLFLFLILPICLIIGPLLAELSMNLITLIFLYKVFKNKEFRLFKNIFFIFFILFSFFIIITIYFSNYFDQIF